jgi:hypothetical protein
MLRALVAALWQTLGRRVHSWAMALKALWKAGMK